MRLRQDFDALPDPDSKLPSLAPIGTEDERRSNNAALERRGVSAIGA